MPAALPEIQRRAVQQRSHAIKQRRRRAGYALANEHVAMAVKTANSQKSRSPPCEWPTVVQNARRGRRLHRRILPARRKFRLKMPAPRSWPPGSRCRRKGRSVSHTHIQPHIDRVARRDQSGGEQGSQAAEHHSSESQVQAWASRIAERLRRKRTMGAKRHKCNGAGRAKQPKRAAGSVLHRNSRPVLGTLFLGLPRRSGSAAKNTAKSQNSPQPTQGAEYFQFTSDRDRRNKNLPVEDCEDVAEIDATWRASRCPSRGPATIGKCGCFQSARSQSKFPLPPLLCVAIGRRTVDKSSPKLTRRTSWAKNLSAGPRILEIRLTSCVRFDNSEAVRRRVLADRLNTVFKERSLAEPTGFTFSVITFFS